MIGILSSDKKGLELLQRWRMFNMMYHVLMHKQRPDLIKLLLTNFDYSHPGHPRVLLEQALTSGTREIRITATNVLRKYATRSVSETARNTDNLVWKWAIRKLVDQLYDPEVEVCRTAVKILEKACNKKAYLEYVVQCRPTMDHLGELSAPLLLRFLSSSSGYHYLDGLDYISNEMDDWFLGKNDSYVEVMETSLAKAFADNLDDSHGRFSMMGHAHDEGVEPESHITPHFYRELARTREGCKLLSDKGHFKEFAKTIRKYGMQSTDLEMMLRVKASMWAVGNVGSMEPGAPFLESCHVVEHIVKIAQEHEVMSMRGTAFFVLGLISRSSHGLEILLECGWDSNLNHRGDSVGFCIPNDLSKFFNFEPWKHCIAAKIELPMSQRTTQTPPPPMPALPPLEKEDLPSPYDDEAVSKRILDLIVDLGNMILYKRAMTELKEIKTRKATGFKCPKLFKRVMAMLEYNHYRLPIRRMVIELFDKSVLRIIVFEEDSDEGEGDETARPHERLIEEDEGGEDHYEGSNIPSSPEEEARLERRRGISDPVNHLEFSQPGSMDDPFGSWQLENKPSSLGENSLAERRRSQSDAAGRRKNAPTQDGNNGPKSESSSGDEGHTERQRSISDPADLEKDTRARGSGRSASEESSE